MSLAALVVRQSSTSSESSLKVLVPQSISGQDQRRLAHTRRTGLPPAGRSRIWILVRPWPTARVPQAPQPTGAGRVWTEMKTSPASSVMASTSKPSIPSRAVAPALPFVIVPCPSQSSSSEDRKTRGPRGPSGGSIGGSPS
jgi:hypothetical protein